MRTHIVYANPTHTGLVAEVLDAFCAGLDEAGIEHTLSDLYAMGFNPVLSPEEFARESAFDVAAPVAEDVRAEQAKLNAADAWVFVYPVWWTDVPAILKGWFDRVWTVGYAYGPDHPETRWDEEVPADGPGIRIAQKVLVLCTAGHSERQLRETGCYQAMETTMLVDRIFTRARTKQFVVLGGGADMTRDEWVRARAQEIRQAHDLGRTLAAAAA